jgi:hypothetical protein
MKRRPKLTVLPLLAILIASACSSERASVDIRRVSTDIAFGKIRSGVVPSNFGPGAAEFPEQDLGFGEEFTKSFGPPLPPPPARCPNAALNAFPEREAGFNVTGLPRVGSYRWKRSGKETRVSLPIPLPVLGFETRLIRNPVRVSANDFTYETVQTDTTFGASTVVVTTWQVKTDPVRQDVDIFGAARTRVGEPERGLSLKQVRRFDRDGKLIGTFAPIPAILILPLPVVHGDTWTSVGTDPTTGESLQHQGTVAGRERVDACGDVVDGWKVDSTESFTGEQTSTREYDYIVATQLGAIVISEKINSTTPQGTLDAVFSLGQLDPDPLPREGS